jgi:hypothetical protein
MATLRSRRLISSVLRRDGTPAPSASRIVAPAGTPIPPSATDAARPPNVHVSRNGSIVIAAPGAAAAESSSLDVAARAGRTPLRAGGETVRQVHISRDGTVSIAPPLPREPAPTTPVLDATRPSRQPQRAASERLQPPPRPSFAAGTPLPAAPLILAEETAAAAAAAVAASSASWRERIRATPVPTQRGVHVSRTGSISISPSPDEAMGATGGFADDNGEFARRQEEGERRRRRAESNRAKRRNHQHRPEALLAHEPEAAEEPAAAAAAAAAQPLPPPPPLEAIDAPSAIDARIDAFKSTVAPISPDVAQRARAVMDELRDEIAEIVALRSRVLVGSAALDRRALSAAPGATAFPPDDSSAQYTSALERAQAAHEREVTELRTAHQRDVARLSAQLSSPERSVPEQRVPPRRPPSHPTPERERAAPFPPPPSRPAATYAAGLRKTLGSLRRGLSACGAKQLDLVLSHFGTARRISESAFAVGILTAAGIAARRGSVGYGRGGASDQHELARAFLGTLYRAVAAVMAKPMESDDDDVPIAALIRGVTAFVHSDAASSARAIVAATSDAATGAEPIMVSRSTFARFISLAAVVMPVFEHMCACAQSSVTERGSNWALDDEELRERLLDAVASVDALSNEIFDAPELRAALTPTSKPGAAFSTERDDVSIAADIFERWCVATLARFDRCRAANAARQIARTHAPSLRAYLSRARVRTLAPCSQVLRALRIHPRRHRCRRSAVADQPSGAL